MKSENEIVSEIASLEKEIKSMERKQEKLVKRYNKMVEAKTCRCFSSYEYHKFGLRRKNRIVELKNPFKNCDSVFPKKDALFVVTEEYAVRQTSSDAGYGDCDSFTWVHQYTKYRVCPKCGAMFNLAVNTVGRSREWCRMDWNRDDVEKLKEKFVPKGCKENVEKVVFVGNEKDCNKFFGGLKNDYC